MTTVQNNTPVSQSVLDSVNGTRNTNRQGINEIQDRFMTLLITQMRNQDPLNPMDNAQVTSQMAQLSTVTGINKLNDTVESLIGSVKAGKSFQASSMIGRSVLVEGNKIIHNGDSSFFGVDLPVGADKLSVTIKDGAGATIRTMQLGAQDSGIAPFNWDGFSNEGVKAGAGYYQFEVSASAGGSPVLASPLSHAQVLSISSNSGNIRLNLNTNSSVNTSDIKEIF